MRNLEELKAMVRQILSEELEVVEEHVRKIGKKKWRLYSKKGKNLGTFSSRASAAKHEGEVEYFKSVGESLRHESGEAEASLAFIKTLPRFVGKGYRHDGQFRFRGTAGDVVRYELEELGNDNNIDSRVMPYLDTVPAKQLTWVTKTRKDAAYYRDYGELLILQFSDESHIIGTDDQGGYLVLQLTHK